MNEKVFLEEFFLIGGITSKTVNIESKFIKDIYIVTIYDGKAIARKIEISLEQPDSFEQRKPYVKFKN